MRSQSNTIERYIAPEGHEPYTEWLNSIKDKMTKARIINGVTKMENGNFGVSESVGAGVLELKLDYGPGYRVYYALEGEKIILLLLGGSKKGQQADIKKAQRYLNDYRSREDGNEENQ